MNLTEDKPLVNKTNCTLLLFSNDAGDILLNILRFTFFFIYLGWHYFAIKYKEFHKSSIAHLYNVAICSFIKASYGVHLTFLPKCFVPTDSYCYFQMFSSLFIMYISGYSISMLALFRLIIVYKATLSVSMQRKIVIITVFISWLLPIFFLLLCFIIFEPQSAYVQTYNLCMAKIKFLTSAILLTIFCVFLLPNLTLIFAYVITLFKIRSLKRKANSNEIAKAPRITLQLVIYIITFQITQVCYIFDMISVTKKIDFVILVQISKVLKWFQNYCSIGLLYFHPVMIQKYKILGNFLRVKFPCLKGINRNNRIMNYPHA